MDLVRGLTRSKTYDWKDSNVALIGSAEDKKVKKESAATEKAWKNAGDKPGLKIWRIENFKVVDWPEKQYGTFYSGDSYIILNTYKEAGGNELLYDLHFWIGSQSTQDEYGSAAYKTVELDTYLNDKPVQHREVEGHESNLFKSYFKNGITLLAGGAESGFHHVKTQEYKPRLLHFHGSRQHVVLNEVPSNPARLNPDDVFILDSGSKIVQWNGSKSNKDERFKASQYANQLRSQRGSCSVEVLEEGDASEASDFIKKLDQPDQPDHIEADTPGEKILLRVSDAGGHLKKEEVKRGSIRLSDFNSEDVFILDSGDNCFVWIGKNASPEEKQNGIAYAHNYLMDTSHALIPVHVIKEGQHSKDFNLAIAA